MKRPQTTTELIADNIRKAELWDKLLERMAANEITVKGTDCDGGELLKCEGEVDLSDLIRGRGKYKDLF